MIGIGRTLIAYPIFRLASCMAAGIFFFATYLTDVVTLPCAALSWIVSALLVLSLSGTRRSYRPVLYGVVLSISAFLFGGTLVLLQCRRVAYNWSSQPCLYQGTILTPPQEKPRTYAVQVNLHTAFVSGADTLTPLPLHRTVLLYLSKDSLASTLLPGQTLSFRARIATPGSDQSPAVPGYVRHLQHCGISGTAFVGHHSWQRLSVPVVLTLRQRALALRDSLLQRYRRMHLGGDELAVLSALTLGDRTELTPEVRSAYTASGASHILALSGMHVGILVLLLHALLRPLTLVPHGARLRTLLLIVLLWSFAFITGLSPSVVRAVGMFTLFALASWFTGQSAFSCHTLALTAFLMLLYRPLYLFDVGFQLSFAAVLSILLFFPQLYGWFQLRNPAVRYLWQVLCLSVSAQLGTLPLVLYHFGAFPTYFLVANLIVAPLAFAILLFALGTLLLGFIPWLGKLLAVVLEHLLLLLNRSMSWIQSLYGSQLTSLHLTLLQALLLATFLLAVHFYARRHSALRLQVLLGTLVLLLLSCLLRGI